MNLNVKTLVIRVMWKATRYKNGQVGISIAAANRSCLAASLLVFEMGHQSKFERKCGNGKSHMVSYFMYFCFILERVRSTNEQRSFEETDATGHSRVKSRLRPVVAISHHPTDCENNHCGSVFFFFFFLYLSLLYCIEASTHEMHGQRRAEYKAKQRDPLVAAKLQQKATQWRHLTAQLPQAPPAVAWELTETLLRVNPDPFYIWNQRRELFLNKLVKKESGNDDNEDVDGNEDEDDDKDAMIEKELNLTAAALQNNPKSYGAWFHRKWVLCQATRMVNDDTIMTTTNIKNLLRQELSLTELFLKRDERNFHCWNYRRFVVALQMQPSSDGSWWLLSEQDANDEATRQIIMGAQVVLDQSSYASKPGPSSSAPSPSTTTATAHTILQAEWEFTRAKIAQNFSNFSAFHYRSKLLQLLWPRVDLGAELQLVEDAVYTEPDDQTAWWYQAFLLDTMKRNDESNDDSSYQERIIQHLESLQELADEVTECKWVRLGMLACLKRLPDTQHRQRELWETLMEMDPDRKVRYQYMISKLEQI